MKTAFSTVACMGVSWQTVLSGAVRAGMDAVEIRMDDDGRIFGLPDTELDTVAQAFCKAGVQISDIGSGIRFADYDAAVVKRARQCVDQAAQLGARGVRVFPGSFVRRFSDPTPHNVAAMARFLREAADYAADKGVEIWIETHNEFSTGAAMRPLLLQAGRGSVKVIWDLIHPIEQGEMPEQTLTYLGDSIAHIHVKDGRKTQDPDQIDFLYTRLGEGELPLRDTLRMLGKSGYTGYYSLKWENAWRPEIRGLYSSLDALLADWNTFLQSVENR